MASDDVLTYAGIALAPALTSVVASLALRGVHQRALSVRTSGVLLNDL